MKATTAMCEFVLSQEKKGNSKETHATLLKQKPAWLSAIYLLHLDFRFSFFKHFSISSETETSTLSFSLSINTALAFCQHEIKIHLKGSKSIVIPRQGLSTREIAKRVHISCSTVARRQEWVWTVDGN